MATRRTLTRPTSVVDERVLHEGWCVKESGTALFGQTNWRRRWFRLIQTGQTTSLRYYKSQKDKTPAGSFKLDVTYCTRQLESGEKSHSNCFAVGPLLDDGASRTYYISCSTHLEMQEWMTAIDAVVQGVPEQVQTRRDTVRKRCGKRPERNSAAGSGTATDPELDLTASISPNTSDSSSVFKYSIEQSVRPETLTEEEFLEDMDMDTGEEGVRDPSTRVHQTVDSGLTTSGKMDSYYSAQWRMERFKDVCRALTSVRWTHEETRDGITLSRSKFGGSRNGRIVMRVEGILPADPNTVYQFLQLSTKEGGKLDYIFRNETLLNSFEDEPRSTIIYNQLLLPIPRISKREVVALKVWVPAYMCRNEFSGFAMVSLDYPEAPPLERGSTRMHIDPSGVVLTPHLGEGGALHTKAVIIVQVAFYGGLHTLVKGAYNSGLLKIGLRTTFSHIATELQKFVDITNI